jgi:hypothetical protein
MDDTILTESGAPMQDESGAPIKKESKTMSTQDAVFTAVNIAQTTIRVTVLSIDTVNRNLSVSLPDGSSTTTIGIAQIPPNNIQKLIDMSGVIVGDIIDIPYPIEAIFDDPSGSKTLIP